ncbi:uncharacterized protein TRIADDRAFT_52359 [Trichoplax adhaerens]|uniref:Histone deacetylase interacting domain-containing protein n=1 Tax=Trichoplax adhaerens TaxID=10228 RepID=B3RI28_TRIAD|nr:hypothetical protein TRIADDRAFT_52359 [Trichoplax adhaerens]EDV28962.1 hypothetical protein TRIADDRAFT_52359 [Trichoplax adhaerens]|eukprot:XP_002108164.1 hypothetical protein TRIADDRAFT_52359 [Trichoplax adhaerens]
MKRSRVEEHDIYKSHVRREAFQPQVLGSGTTMNISQGYEIADSLSFPTQMATGQAFQQVTTVGHPAPPTLAQSTHAQTITQVHVPQAQHQQFQRLKVEDALSYLDEVKRQFGNQPQVYNDFLDIMKDFKSQSIDTPGVINRVSNLFKGHPDLIMGFNTFLPPGYKIEVHSNSAASPHHTTTTVTYTNNQQQFRVPHQQQSPQPQTQQHAPPAPIQQQQQQQQQQQNHNQQHPVPVSQANTQAHPMEFNHAINYVNKIKNRFKEQPNVYRDFLEILHSYQKEQKSIREVYSRVAELFQDSKDLLNEFSQFLPDGSGAHLSLSDMVPFPIDSALIAEQEQKETLSPKKQNHEKLLVNKKPTTSKRSSNNNSTTVTNLQVSGKKRNKGALKDVSLSEASKHGTFNELAFFDKVRKAFRNQAVYDNFLRCLTLFNEEVITRSELLTLVTPFLGKFPELLAWFRIFIGHKEPNNVDQQQPGSKDRTNNEITMEIDFSTCKRYGASYRALPKTFNQPKCSGRSPLCKEVLNDTWVSFPSWSEDSTFVSSRKTQFEEHIYRCEDERFELDIVIEANAATIKVLESVQKKLSRMNPDEVSKFRLDNRLSGTSDVIYRKAIQRLYGDKAIDIIDSLKKNPSVAVPIVLKRLKAKDEEWREARRGFNKVWKDINEKYYLKGITFKTNDLKALRSKNMISEIENIFEERRSQIRDGEPPKFHLSFACEDKSVLDDAASLIIHHMKRQTNIHKNDKTKIKQILGIFIPDFFFAPRGEMSDDEDNSSGDDDNGNNSGRVKGSRSNGITESATNDDTDDVYSLYFVNNQWYVFFRLHQTLCERLCKIYHQAIALAEEEAANKHNRKEAVAVALRLKPSNDVDMEEYYPHYLDMVRNLLDGNLDSSAFEDQCREMFGTHAYLSFTVDKLIQSLVRQLHAIVGDETCMKVKQLFSLEQVNGGAIGSRLNIPANATAEVTYQKKAEQIIGEDTNCYRIMLWRDGNRLTIELLDTINDNSDENTDTAVAEPEEEWQAYVNKFVVSPNIPSSNQISDRKVFLLRNRSRVRSSSCVQGLSKRVGDDSNATGLALQKEETEDQLAKFLLMFYKKYNLQYTFNINSYQISYISGTGDLLYRYGSLPKVRQVNQSLKQRQSLRFKKWLDVWHSEKTNTKDMLKCSEWLGFKYVSVGEHELKEESEGYSKPQSKKIKLDTS